MEIRLQPYEIPQDLKALYESAQEYRHSYGSKKFVGAGTVEVLIERIAKSEAQVRRLKEALGEARAFIAVVECEDGLTTANLCDKIGAALSGE